MASRSDYKRSSFNPPQNKEQKEGKVVIIDADSLSFICAYTGKDEEGNKKPEYTETEYGIAEGIVTEWVFKILNAIEEHYDISGIFMCVKGKNNFRKKILETYKQNREEPLPIVGHLHNYLVNHHYAYEAPIGEADDVIYTISKKLNFEAIICGIDEDLKSIPGIHYNYVKQEWSYMTEDESRLHLALKVLTGDAGDNVKVNKGLGPKKASKIVSLGMSNYQFVRRIYETYIQYNGQEVAKDLLKKTYKLLKLHNIEEIDFYDNLDIK